MSIEKLREIRNQEYLLRELRKISNSLHSLNECACNYGLTERQEKREKRLEEKAQIIAKELDLAVYFQGDPRGCALYLVPKDWTKEYTGSHYPEGLAIC